MTKKRSAVEEAIACCSGDGCAANGTRSGPCRDHAMDLVRALRAAKKDATRLEYLEQGAELLCDDADEIERFICTTNRGHSGTWEKTARAAIDAAIRARRKGGKK